MSVRSRQSQPPYFIYRIEGGKRLPVCGNQFDRGLDVAQSPREHVCTMISEDNSRQEITNDWLARLICFFFCFCKFPNKGMSADRKKTSLPVQVLVLFLCFKNKHLEIILDLSFFRRPQSRKVRVLSCCLSGVRLDKCIAYAHGQQLMTHSWKQGWGYATL